MAQFHIIKYLYEVEGLSQRKIANKLGISRNTVSKYLKSNQPPTIIQREKSYGKKEFSSETKRILPIIDQWLEEDFKRWENRDIQLRIFIEGSFVNMVLRSLNPTLEKL